MRFLKFPARVHTLLIARERARSHPALIEWSDARVSAERKPFWMRFPEGVAARDRYRASRVTTVAQREGCWASFVGQCWRWSSVSARARLAPPPPTPGRRPLARLAPYLNAILYRKACFALLSSPKSFEKWKCSWRKRAARAKPDFLLIWWVMSSEHVCGRAFQVRWWSPPAICIYSLSRVSESMCDSAMSRVFCYNAAGNVKQILRKIFVL